MMPRPGAPASGRGQFHLSPRRGAAFVAAWPLPPALSPDPMTLPPPSDPGEPPPLPEPNAAPEPAAGTIAGFWRRLGAFCVDSALLGVGGMIIGAAAFDRLAQLGRSGRWIGFVIAAVYFGIGNSALGGGQTPGKRLLHIAVVDRTGAPIGLGRAFIRYVVLVTPFFLNGLSPARVSWTAPSTLLLALAVPVLGFAIIYLAIFNRRTRQSVHDLVVGTYVVRQPVAGTVAAPPVWRVHFAVIGAFVVAGFAGTYVASIRVGGLLAQLVDVRRAILATGKVHDAGVFAGKAVAWQNGVTTHTRYILVTALVKQRPIDEQVVAAQFAAVLLAKDPAAAGEDVIQVNLVYGYDIGIARASITRQVRHTPAEWAALAGTNPGPGLTI